MHVDSLPPSSNIDARQACTETYASTRPYPVWWSELDESRILRRRKSMGDQVLERNICFVEASSARVENIIHYLEQALQQSLLSFNVSSPSLPGLLSGRGGSQVDVLIYLMTRGNQSAALRRLKQ